MTNPHLRRRNGVGGYGERDTFPSAIDRVQIGEQDIWSRCSAQFGVLGLLGHFAPIIAPVTVPATIVPNRIVAKNQ